MWKLNYALNLVSRYLMVLTSCVISITYWWGEPTVYFNEISISITEISTFILSMSLAVMLFTHGLWKLKKELF